MNPGTSELSVPLIPELPVDRSEMPNWKQDNVITQLLDPLCALEPLVFCLGLYDRQTEHKYLAYMGGGDFLWTEISP